MTPIPEATVEAVARAFCKRMGMDPDKKATLPNSGARLPLWRHFSMNAREAIAMQLALHDAGVKGE